MCWTLDPCKESGGSLEPQQLWKAFRLPLYEVRQDGLRVLIPELEVLRDFTEMPGKGRKGREDEDGKVSKVLIS